ncbi:Uncharacterized protein HZ326_7607 [Fusarium oxysporum f. sp. albedinis]|nr:Uncharacterized protein HZ326_7607 [Fusarium oxysporum f. sp. albedinis]
MAKEIQESYSRHEIRTTVVYSHNLAIENLSILSQRCFHSRQNSLSPLSNSLFTPPSTIILSNFESDFTLWERLTDAF